MRNFILLATTLMLIFTSLARAANLNENSAPWWENETVTATGHGLSPYNIDSLNFGGGYAKRAAMADAYRRLAAQVSGIQVTADEKILQSKVSALIRDAEILSESYDSDGVCTIILSVPLYGVENSVAKSAFELGDKENFPPPSEYTTASGNYTGLIIDCGDMELNPVLAPVILNETNRAIYSRNHLDYNKLISSGMVGYEEKFSEVMLLSVPRSKNHFVQVGSNFLLADNSAEASRAGDHPLIVKAADLEEDNSNPVISSKDADKILAENSATHFLDEGAVVFMSKRIRGMRL